MTKQNSGVKKLKVALLTLTLGTFVTGAANAMDEIEALSLLQTNSDLNAIVKDELEKNMVVFTPTNKQNTSAILKMQSQDKNFKMLNSKNLLKDKEFQTRYGSNNIIQARKIIFEMQSFSSHIVKEYKVDLPTAEKIVYTAYIESHKEDLSPVLTLSLIGIESSYNPKARSVVGATGLMQVMPNIHKTKVKKLGVDLHSIEGNIKVGLAVLKEYLTIDNGNIKKALQRYNGSYKDTSLKYSKLVLGTMDSFKAIQAKNEKLFSVFES